METLLILAQTDLKMIVIAIIVGLIIGFVLGSGPAE